jgi:hypothetical protein
MAAKPQSGHLNDRLDGGMMMSPIVREYRSGPVRADKSANIERPIRGTLFSIHWRGEKQEKNF